MHPQITSDKPGDCPICGMHLVEQKKAAPAAGTTAAKKTMYRSTMNPNEVSDKPGKDSMGMDMVPFEVEEKPAAAPTGLADITITPEQRTGWGLPSGRWRCEILLKTYGPRRALCRMKHELYRVTTKIDGYVDKLFVNVTGQEVKKGQPLLSSTAPSLLLRRRSFSRPIHGEQCRTVLTNLFPKAEKAFDCSPQAAEALGYNRCSRLPGLKKPARWKKT